jgi:hypothetical protein
MHVRFRRSFLAVAGLLVGSGVLVWLWWILFPLPPPRPYSLLIEDREAALCTPSGPSMAYGG